MTTSTEFAPVFSGWNVWSIYQTKDLDFSVMLVGLTREHRLALWVEDQIRLNAPNSNVADPLALKGSQIQLLPAEPIGLIVENRKEDVPGPAMTLNAGLYDVRYVRFYNRGQNTRLLWPHDGNYLLNEVFKPSLQSPITSGPGPTTTTGGITTPVGNAIAEIMPLLVLAGGIYIVGKLTRD